MDIKIPDVDFSFEALIKRRASELCNKFFALYAFQDPYQRTLEMAKKDIGDSLWEFYNAEHRIIYINEILLFITKMKGKFLADKYSERPENVNRKEQYQKSESLSIISFEDMQFFLYDLLSKEGLKADSNAFSSDEIFATENKIDDIIEAVNRLHLGHEAIYSILEEFKEDLNSLKSDVTSGKKRFYQRAAGLVFSYGSTLAADAVFDPIKPLIRDLLIDYSKEVVQRLLS